MVSITGDLETVSAHGVHIKADKLVEEVNPADYDAVITPGGIPGSTSLLKMKQYYPVYNLFIKRIS